jgi:hypothetical protein
MSLLFSHYDRTNMCNHEGVLGRPDKDGQRICVRCGNTILPETFASPAGTRSKPASRPDPR